jgi:hypothetical protein
VVDPLKGEGIGNTECRIGCWRHEGESWQEGNTDAVEGTIGAYEDVRASITFKVGNSSSGNSFGAEGEGSQRVEGEA